VAQSGDISALHQSCEFNNCLPVDITFYRAPPGMHPSLSEDDMQKSIHSLWMSGDIVAIVVYFAWISDHEQKACNISQLFYVEH
jgi:hypothetical protein